MCARAPLTEDCAWWGIQMWGRQDGSSPNSHPGWLFRKQTVVRPHRGPTKELGGKELHRNLSIDTMMIGTVFKVTLNDEVRLPFSERGIVSEEVWQRRCMGEV